MLVNSVYEFIQSLVSIEEKLSETDKKLLRLFQEKFPPKYESLDIIGSASVELNESELHWILQAFYIRWQEIADDSEDYTFDPRGNNALWIKFSKLLATECNKPYLQILIPVITNFVDPDIFSQLSEEQDPRSIYLAEDGKTWHRIKGLVDRLKHPKNLFSIYDLPKTMEPRALSLKELYRIRSKRGEELVKEINNKKYLNFWDYLIQEVAPTWKELDQSSPLLLRSLVDLIENYFKSQENPDFTKAFHHSFINLQTHLNTSRIEEVNYFYGLKIIIGKEQYFLMDLLLDVIEKKDDLTEKFINIALWLCNENPSLIVNADILMPLYEEKGLGKFFNIKELKRTILALTTEDEVLATEISILLSEIDQATEISSALIDHIKTIFSLRWQSIRDKEKDYLRNTEEVNAVWIRLAQTLAGANLIDSNYFKLLIPTLTQDIDPVTSDPLTYYPLNHYILSEDETELIFLPNSVNHYKANGTFYNCNFYEPRLFSRIETNRITYAKPYFYTYYLKTKPMIKNNVTIHEETVNAIKSLVNGTLNPIGLLLGRELSLEQKEIAEKSYIKFLAFLDTISKDELSRLYAQTISWRGKKKFFSQIMQEIQDPQFENRECIALAGQLLAKLVIDYDPNAEFSKEIQKKGVVALDEMRETSARRVTADYDWLDKKEATRRILYLLISLMTHSFNYMPFTGVHLKILDHENIITETGKELFKVIEPLIESADFEQARFVYSYSIKNIINRAISDKKWTRFEDTLNWLRSVENGSMFHLDRCTYFEPAILIKGLSSFAFQSKYKNLYNFVDKIVQILMQPHNEYLSFISVNIEFTKFLKTLGTTNRFEILNCLRETKLSESENLLTICGDFFVKRLSWLNTVSCCKKQGLFGIGPGYFQVNYEENLTLFETYWTNFKDKLHLKEHSLGELINYLQETMEPISNESRCVFEYLSRLNNSSSEDEINYERELMVF